SGTWLKRKVFARLMASALSWSWRLLVARDDTADEVEAMQPLGVEGAERAGRYHGGGECRQLRLLGAAQGLALLGAHRGKADFIARPLAPDGREVGRDDGRDLGIAAGCLVVGEEQDRLARARHLDRPGGDAIGDDVVAVAMRQKRPVEAQAH